MQDLTWNDVDSSAQRAEIRRLLSQYHREHFEKGKFPSGIPAEILEKLEYVTNQNKKSNCLFITINYKPEPTEYKSPPIGKPVPDSIPYIYASETLEKIARAHNKLINKKWIKDLAYVFESGENEHLHTHILIHRNGKVPSEVIREFKSPVSKLCNTENPHCFNVKFLPDDPDIWLQKIEYMMGNKTDSKLESVKNSEITLKEMNLSIKSELKIPIGIQFVGTRFPTLVETRTKESSSDSEETDAEASEDSDDSATEEVHQPGGIYGRRNGDRSQSLQNGENGQKPLECGT